MSKKILVISTSPRKGGNSDALADAFVRGAQEAGNQVEKVTLYDKTIGFCRGCLTCQSTGHCVIRDDAAAIARKMGAADVIAFATPIYYYGMCGQMKTMLDRANPLFAADYQFRDIYLLSAAAEEDEHTVDGAVTGLMGWIDPKRLQIPKTGDSSVLGLWGISLCTSLAGCLALTTWQIRRRREEESLQIIEK